MLIAVLEKKPTGQTKGGAHLASGTRRKRREKASSGAKRSSRGLKKSGGVPLAGCLQRMEGEQKN